MPVLNKLLFHNKQWKRFNQTVVYYRGEKKEKGSKRILKRAKEKCFLQNHWVIMWVFITSQSRTVMVWTATACSQFLSSISQTQVCLRLSSFRLLVNKSHHLLCSNELLPAMVFISHLCLLFLCPRDLSSFAGIPTKSTHHSCPKEMY